MKSHPVWLFIILAFGLRAFFVLHNSISFHYDMARDAFAIREIWQGHNPKILGPPSSTPGFYHGVLYYYLLAPFYALGQGDPRVASLALALINSLTLFPIYFLAQKIFNSRVWAVVACLLFSISYISVQFGTWLSNPSPAVVAAGFFFFGLYLWHEKHHLGLPIAALSAALAAQFEFFLIYLFVLLPVFKYFFRPKTSPGSLWQAISLVILGLSTYLIAILKFGTYAQFITSLFGVLVNQSSTSAILFSTLFLNYLDKLAALFTNILFPVNLFIGGLLGLIAVFLVRFNKFLAFAVFSSLPLFIFGGHNSGYGNIGLLVPAILASVGLIKAIYSKDKFLGYIMLLTIVIGNSFTYLTAFQNGQVVLVIPRDMVLSQQLKLIDQTYAIAGGKEFSINSLTLPLWTNTTWAYLYGWYGKSKYGYLPKFYGRDQTGMPGDNELGSREKPLPISFFIIEPDTGIRPEFFAGELIAENSKTELVTEQNFNGLRLQLRKPI